jgi:hypothetical protein
MNKSYMTYVASSTKSSSRVQKGLTHIFKEIHKWREFPLKNWSD